MSDRYLSASSYYKKTFNCKVYKLSINGGFTCPNRDGKVAFGGCIFCSNVGSGEYAFNISDGYTEAINNAKKLISKKIDSNTKFICYFQSYTSTYMEPKAFKKMLDYPLNDDSIVAINIATRPDCLEKDILEVINNANKIKPIYVELGLQTIHEDTAKLINRGYLLPVYNKAVNNLHSLGVNVITHLIIGLPYETKEMIIESIKYVGKVTDGIKLQLLHVIKNTKLEEMYKDYLFNVLTLEEYANIVCEGINYLPKNVVVYRITGDGNKKDLVAPMWSTNKKNVLNYINHKMKELNCYQGKLIN